MAAAKQIAVRAWQIGPTWLDAVGLAVSCALLVWLWEMPWLAAALISAVAYAALFGLFGWLDLLNEAADTEEQDGPAAADGMD